MRPSRRSAAPAERPATIGDSGEIGERADGSSNVNDVSPRTRTTSKQIKKSKRSQNDPLVMAPAPSVVPTVLSVNKSAEKRANKSRVPKQPTGSTTNNDKDISRAFPTTSQGKNSQRTTDNYEETLSNSGSDDDQSPVRTRKSTLPSQKRSLNQALPSPLEESDNENPSPRRNRTPEPSRKRQKTTALQNVHWTESLQQFLQNQVQNQIRICKFSGNPNEDFDLWLIEFNHTVERNQLDDAKALHLFRGSLKGEALSIFIGIHPKLVSTIAQAQYQMNRLYSSKNSTLEWKLKLRTAKMFPEENFRKFAQRVHKLVLKVFPSSNEETIEEHLVEYFTNGLRTDLRKRLQVRSPKTIEDAIQKAIKYDADIKVSTANKANLIFAGTAAESSTENEDLEIKKSKNANERN